MLDLSHCLLSCLPAEVAKLVGLRELYLRGDHGMDLPAALMQLTGLRLLDLSELYSPSFGLLMLGSGLSG